MKKILLMLSGTLVMAISTNAQTLVHYWHFNNLAVAYHNPGIPAIKANYSTLDTNKATVAYTLIAGAPSTYTGYIDNTTGSDSNARMSTIAGNCLRVRNPSDSMELRLYIPTTGYKNIAVKYALQSSSNGQLAETFDYSVDSGSTWITTGLNMTTNTVTAAQKDPNWGIISLDFGATTTVNNNPKLVLRIKFSGQNTGASGNHRIDNITVEGDATTSVSNTISPLQQSTVYPNPTKEQVTIRMPLAGVKSVTVLNETGAVVSQMQTAEKELTMNVAGFAAGNYFILVNNKITNTTEQIRFLKQ